MEMEGGRQGLTAIIFWGRGSAKRLPYRRQVAEKADGRVRGNLEGRPLRHPFSSKGARCGTLSRSANAA
jgi:hypothetical protein